MAKVLKNVMDIPAVRGGTTKMFGRQYAGPQEPGCTSHCTTGSGDKFPKGGNGHMVGPQHAKPAKAC